MLINVVLFIWLVGLIGEASGENEGLCSTDENTSCADSIDSHDEFSYEILRNIKKALAGYQPCSSDVNDANCSCHAAVIKRDLAPYKATGVSRQMIESSAKFGTRYKIYEKSLYRDETCMFPARCQGIEHFLQPLVATLPNMDLVINTRDYPQVNTAWGNGGQGPILSFSKTKDHRDIMYPAWTFWAGGPATKLHPRGIGRWDLMREKLEKHAAAIPWSQKRELGFFRGSRTSDERDSLILLSRRSPELVEAQYTKNQGWKSPKDTLDAPPADEVSFEDHCKYKYLFNFRGVAASFRLKHLFLCQSLIFHVGDEWQEFFYDQLKPWVHYVPLKNYPSEQEYEQLLTFFRKNDALAQEIAQRGRDFIWQHLRMKDIECYWRKLLKGYVKLLTYEVRPEDNLIYIKPAKDEL
ncbi:O-glucosyltransferase rumi [Drosophila guanche]|uniref:Blast:O-glucosyltransferase rumi n=1 Tax=Drosophila guanche TaxID=7266 RepID=A0A3B0KBF9_DROGU|nr:O-glucosyltransferase rumi [Drosophila guanche]SPP83006.1 blast:O-glucosyltransferase rumi [Drosophila guanche]